MTVCVVGLLRFVGGKFSVVTCGYLMVVGNQSTVVASLVEFVVGMKNLKQR